MHASASNLEGLLCQFWNNICAKTVDLRMENNTNFSNHGSESHNFHAKPFVVVNCALNAPLMLVSILGNTLILAAIIRTPSIRSPSMIMLCSLAATDLLVGLIAQPLFIADELIMKNHVLNAVSAMIGFALSGFSLTIITAISMDRFIALQYHLRYATLVTNSRVIYSIVAVWLIILIYSGLRLWDNVLFHLLSAIFTGVYLAISTLCYIKIYQIVRRHKLQIRSQEQATKSHIIQNRIEKMRLKQSALNTFVFCISMIACYFPSYVLLFLFILEFLTPHGKLNGPSRLPLCSWTRPWIQFSFAGVSAIFGLQLWRRPDICYAPPLINFKNINFCQTILASKCNDKLRLSWLNSAKNPNLYKKLNQSGTSENVVKLVRLRHLGFKSREW